MSQSGNSIPAASVAVFRDGRVLLALRARPRLWSLPGGRIEPAETAEQAALRGLGGGGWRCRGLFLRKTGGIGPPISRRALLACALALVLATPAAAQGLFDRL